MFKTAVQTPKHPQSFINSINFFHPMSDIALSIKGLKKTYAGGFQALKGIDLEVKKGDFFALLGPNGAGKTTMINIIMNLVNKTNGKVKVLGYDIDTNSEEAKRQIGFTPQEFNFDIFEKVIDIVIRQAGYYGIHKNIARKNAEKYLKKLGLWEKRNETARTLSGGMKRRLMIARALVHEPKILILDEPTAGIDIEMRKSMWEFIKGINKQGVTIILTTHYLEEAESLCRNIAIINHGEIIENTSMKNLFRKSKNETFIFDIENNTKSIPKLKNYNFKILDKSSIEVNFNKNGHLNELFEHFQKNKIKILNMRRKSTKLEELFLEIINPKK